MNESEQARNTDQADTSQNDIGLTKPLRHNVGGVIDQDAPAADQILGADRGQAWGDATVVSGDHEWGAARGDDGVIPSEPGQLPGDQADREGRTR